MLSTFDGDDISAIVYLIVTGFCETAALQKLHWLHLLVLVLARNQLFVQKRRLV